MIVADRDLLDSADVFRCLSAEDGLELWNVTYPAIGELDYGNSPRATPLIHDGRVYLLGAFGHLNCVDLESGEVVWAKHLAEDFAAEPPTWGYCSSPLVVDGKLIVNPGAAEASLAALDAATGEVVWTAPGRKAAYGSFVVTTLGGKRQLVGYDDETLGGWDVATGHRLWELTPPRSGDFNVPTPISVGDRLLATTENNGTRLYGFRPDGTIDPKPQAVNEDLGPDSSTPVVVDGRVYGCWEGLHALDLTRGLKPVWTSDEKPYRDYASLIAAPGRLLVTTAEGELRLVDTTADGYRLASTLRPFAEDVEVHSHPALAGSRLYVRSGTSVVCLELEPN